MLWNLNDATLSAIVNRIEKDPEFYEPPQSVDVPQLLSKIKRRSMPNFQAKKSSRESPIGKSRTWRARTRMENHETRRLP